MDNQEKREFETLSVAQNAYLEDGYTEQFDTRDGKIVALGSKKEYNPEELLMRANLRFEGMTNPGDNMILMVLEATDGTKGTMVDNYGGPDNAQDPELVKRIPMIEDENDHH